MPSLTKLADRHTIIDRREGEYICFPDVVQADDGRLIIAYNESDKHVSPTRRALLVKTSTDNGQTWGEIHRVGAARSHCPRLTKLADGEILLSDSIQVLHRSHDSGKTWETHPIKGLGHDMIDRIIDLGDDVFLTTGHMHRGTAEHPAIGQAPAEQMVYRSEDRGYTWKPLSVIARERNLVLCEASMVLMPDGRILALMRENSFVFEPMYLCVSHDSGCTWSDPVPTPLIGHRPTIGLTPNGDLLVTYRNVAPDGGTCAWIGTEKELLEDFKVQGRHPNPAHPVLTNEGLHINSSDDLSESVCYALRPLTDPRSAEVQLKIRLKINSAEEHGCGIYFGTWWLLQTDRINQGTDEMNSWPAKLDQFSMVELNYSNGDVTISIDGETIAGCSLAEDNISNRPLIFGTSRHFEDNAADFVVDHISLDIQESRLDRTYQWMWDSSQSALPDQWAQDNILELRNDRKASAPDFGYSGWTPLEDGSFYCVYHHGGGDEEGYEPLHSAHVVGTRFSRDDFK